MAKGIGGPAKGAGNGNPKAPPVNGSNSRNTPRESDGKFVAAKLRKWREEHPSWQERPAGPSKKELREYVAGAMPDVIDKAIEIALDDNQPKQFEAIKMLTEQHLGKPSQALEIGGADGGPLKIVFSKDDQGVL